MTVGGIPLYHTYANAVLRWNKGPRRLLNAPSLGVIKRVCMCVWAYLDGEVQNRQSPLQAN